MSEHPIEGLMRTTMDNLKQMIDVNTIIGTPVEAKDGSVIIPISKVSVGFASGGSEFGNELKPVDQNSKYPFGGGSGAGVSVSPVAFLIVGNNQVKLLPVNQANSIERMLESIPDLINQIANMFKKDKNNGNQGTDFNAS